MVNRICKFLYNLGKHCFWGTVAQPLTGSQPLYQDECKTRGYFNLISGSEGCAPITIIIDMINI
jgi:hypothetical protein